MSDIEEPLEKDTEVQREEQVAPAAPSTIPPDQPPPLASPVRKPRRRPPSLFWPLVLIGAGVILLLSNLGYLPWESWNILWRLWPLVLVALGLDLLIGRRSLIGAIVSAILILLLIGGAVAVVLFAQNIPVWVEVSEPIAWRTEHIEYPMGSVEQASVTIDFTSVPCYLSALRDSPHLIQGDITYRGQLIFDVQTRRNQADVELDSHYSGIWLGPDLFDRGDARWDVNLNPDVPLDLTLDVGSGRCDLDLTGLHISDFFIDVGSGSVDLALPSTSTFEGRIDGGSGHLDIILPKSAGMQVDLDSGSGAFRPDDRFRLVEGERGEDGVWETQGFRTAEHKIVLKIDQGSGSINIR
jgi:hypothetical protein